jgi:hypothetical protein
VTACYEKYLAPVLCVDNQTPIILNVLFVLPLQAKDMLKSTRCGTYPQERSSIGIFGEWRCLGPFKFVSYAIHVTGLSQSPYFIIVTLHWRCLEC